MTNEEAAAIIEKMPAYGADKAEALVLAIAALRSPEWGRCAVYLGQRLIGTFIVTAPGQGEPRRGGSDVEEGKR